MKSNIFSINLNDLFLEQTNTVYKEKKQGISLYCYMENFQYNEDIYMKFSTVVRKLKYHSLGLRCDT